MYGIYGLRRSLFLLLSFYAYSFYYIRPNFVLFLKILGVVRGPGLLFRQSSHMCLETRMKTPSFVRFCRPLNRVDFITINFNEMYFTVVLSSVSNPIFRGIKFVPLSFQNPSKTINKGPL